MKNLKKILLVEDDPGDVELTLTALKEQHLANRVVVVRDGEEALDYLFSRGQFTNREGGTPAVVFLDNKMPKIGGLEVLKTIRADEHLRTVPVVVLSSSGEPRDLIDFYKNGVNGYVVKPLDFREYIKAVQQLGSFWAIANEPPPSVPGTESRVQNADAVPVGKQ